MKRALVTVLLVLMFLPVVALDADFNCVNYEAMLSDPGSMLLI